MVDWAVPRFDLDRDTVIAETGNGSVVRRARGQGHSQMRLGVYTANTSGATMLYESLCMTVRRRYDVDEKHGHRRVNEDRSRGRR